MTMDGTRRTVKARIAGDLSRGVLEVNIDDAGWGAVCDDGFGDDEAKAFCSSMGYQFGVGGQYDTTHGDGSFAADDISCPSGSDSISDCSSARRPYSDNCGDSETVGIDCQISTARDMYIYWLASANSGNGAWYLDDDLDDTGSFCASFYDTPNVPMGPLTTASASATNPHWVCYNGDHTCGSDGTGSCWPQQDFVAVWAA